MSSTEITSEQRQEEAEVAFSIEKRIKEAIADGRHALWRLAEAAYEFDEEHGWLKLGHENLSQWLADADVTLTRATYYRYVRTWRKLVVEKQIDADRIRLLDQSKVAIVADKIVANEVLVEDALNDVESLGAQDLREKYYAKKPASNIGQIEDLPPIRPPLPDAEFVDMTITTVPLEAPLTGEDIAEIDEARAERDIDPGEAAALTEVAVEATAVEIVDAYEMPDWVTSGSVGGLLSELSSAIDSGASFPRIARRHCQVAEQLAKAWHATRGS